MILQDQVIMWSPGVSLEAIEKQVILKALSHFKNNKTVTAGALGIAIRTLDNKLDKYEYEAQMEQKRQQEDEQRRREFLDRARGNPPNNIGIPFSPTQQSRAFPSTPAGPRMESFANSASQPEMPLPQREEIQTVLSKHSSPNGEKRRR